jgi:hypothetical protein
MHLIQDERAVFAEMVTLVFPVLLSIFQQLLIAPSTSVEVAEYMKLICKIFWSSTYMGIPDILISNLEHTRGWMEGMTAAVAKPVPLVGSIVNCESGTGSTPPHPF